MARVVGLDRATERVNNAVNRALRGPVAEVAKTILNDRIQRGVTVGGERMPTKAASTIKQYKRKGWNTKTFLDRTGESRRLRSRMKDKFTLVVYPADPETLKFNTPDSHGRDTETFAFNKNEQDRVMATLGSDVARQIK